MSLNNTLYNPVMCTGVLTSIGRTCVLVETKFPDQSFNVNRNGCVLHILSVVRDLCVENLFPTVNFEDFVWSFEPDQLIKTLVLYWIQPDLILFGVFYIIILGIVNRMWS